MNNHNKYEISDIIENWIGESRCFLGFTVTYPNGFIENIMRVCDKDSYETTLNFVSREWRKYNNNNINTKEL